MLNIEKTNIELKEIKKDKIIYILFIQVKIF